MYYLLALMVKMTFVAVLYIIPGEKVGIMWNLYMIFFFIFASSSEFITYWEVSLLRFIYFITFVYIDYRIKLVKFRNVWLSYRNGIVEMWGMKFMIWGVWFSHVM